MFAVPVGFASLERWRVAGRDAATQRSFLNVGALNSSRWMWCGDRVVVQRSRCRGWTCSRSVSRPSNALLTHLRKVQAKRACMAYPEPAWQYEETYTQGCSYVNKENTGTFPASKWNCQPSHLHAYERGLLVAPIAAARA